MNIVVLGAGGQLGQALCRVLPGAVVGLNRSQADLTQPIALRQVLEAQRPRIVVNAAGFTHVDRAETEPERAFAVNALAVRDLAMTCRDLDAVLVHFSTNYVFGLQQMRDAPYDEDDAPGPVNVYGASKLAGEHFVRSLCPKHFILRSAGLYGMAGNGRGNFVDAMLQKDASVPIRVVDDQFCTPTSAVDLAGAAVELLDSQAFGLYHVTSGGACTWFEFAEAIFELANRDMPLVPIKSDAYASPAHRPRFSVLSNRRWINTGFTPLRPWRAALADYLVSPRYRVSSSG